MQFSEVMDSDSIRKLNQLTQSKALGYRNRATAIFAYYKKIPINSIAGIIGCQKNTIRSYIKRFKAGSRERKLRIVTHPEIKSYLTDGLRSPIRKLMWKYVLKIELQADDNMEINEVRYYSKKSDIDITDKFKA